MAFTLDGTGLTGGARPDQNAPEPLPDESRGYAQTIATMEPRVILGAGVFGFFAQLYHQRYFFHDDAYISLRFARNLLEHGALDWNLGERVEGYTNFLHIIATVLVMALGAEPVLAVRIVNALAVAALVGVCWTALSRLLPDQRYAQERAIGMALVLLAAPLPLWLLGGLETVMSTALVTAAVVLLLPPAFSKEGAGTAIGAKVLVGSGILFGAAILTRPDAAASAAAAILGILLFHGGTFPARLRAAAVVAIPAAIIVIAHVAWRYSYYGEFVPNTFYAKVGVPALPRLVNGVGYLVHLGLELPAVLLGVLMCVWALAHDRMSATIRMLGLVMLVHLAAIVWAGGDHMPGARMLLPMIGIAGITIAVVIAGASGELRTGAVLMAMAVGFYGFIASGQERMDAAAYIGTAVGQHLDRTEPPGTLVALATAGSVPFHAPRLRYIDMLGLVDRTIARRTKVPMILPWQYVPGHAKGDGDYILARKPDVIVLGAAMGSLAGDPWFLSDMEIAANPEFHRCYKFDSTPIFFPEETRAAAPRWKIENVFIHYRRICPS